MRALRKDAVNRSVEEICKSTGVELGRIASDVSVRKPLAGEALGGVKDMIVNWAFLVSQDIAPDFCACVRRANELCAVPGLVFEISGPWPPYSFRPCLEEEEAAVSFLLYCILRSSARKAAPRANRGKRRACPVHHAPKVLAAPCHASSPSELALNPSRILAYERIVARLHCRYTVIPMRYGCVLDEECRVVRLLEERRDQFSALLKELAGCVEMGVRVLPGRNEAEACEAQRAVWRPHCAEPAFRLPRLRLPGRSKIALCAKRRIYGCAQGVCRKSVRALLPDFSSSGRWKAAPPEQGSLSCRPRCFLFIFWCPLNRWKRFAKGSMK